LNGKKFLRAFARWQRDGTVRAADAGGEIPAADDDEVVERMSLADEVEESSPSESEDENDSDYPGETDRTFLGSSIFFIFRFI